MIKLYALLHVSALVALVFMFSLFACYATEPRFSASANALRDAGVVAGIVCFLCVVLAHMLEEEYQRARRVNTRNA